MKSLFSGGRRGENYLLCACEFLLTGAASSRLKDDPETLAAAPHQDSRREL